MSVEVTDSMKYFENIILKIAENTVSKCEGVSTSPDVCELSMAMLLLDQGKYQKEGDEFSLLNNKYIVWERKEDFGVQFCESDVLEKERKKGMDFTACEQQIVVTVEPNAGIRHVIDYFAACIWEVNQENIVKEELTERDHEGVWVAISHLNPVTFVLVNMNLLYGFLCSLTNNHSSSSTEITIRDYLCIITKIVKLSNPTDIYKTKMKYMNTYRKKFPNSTKNLKEVQQDIISKYTSTSRLGTTNKMNQVGFLPHLILVERIIEKYCELYPKQLSNEDRKAFEKYINLLRDKRNVDNGASEYFQKKIEFEWERKIDNAKQVEELKEIVRGYCGQKDVFLAVANS